MKVLVLGGYGLIGTAIVRALLQAGHHVIGLARSRQQGERLIPEAAWIGADIAALTEPGDWQPHLQGIDAVVNASGVLQSGLGDHVSRTQGDAIIALVAACEAAKIQTFVQISAPGVSPTADTEFYRSKAAADAAVMASRLNWTIFRPGLVLAPQAYGGTRLLRMLAACPVIVPIALADAKIQCVSVEDVAEAVTSAISGDFARKDFDLVEREAHSLEALVLHIRRWMGLPAPNIVVRIPQAIARGISLIADVAGWLGWRSGLRSTALTVLARDVVGDGARWTDASGHSFKSLRETLRDLPATSQERVAARGALVFPLLLFVFSAFWVASGAIAIWQAEAAMAVVMPVLSSGWGATFVLGGAVIDIVIGLAALVRPLTRMALLASILVAGAYLAGSLFVAPGLWADPLGPIVKVFPAMALSVALLALNTDR
ncbi:MAG: SDR family oxidoreductase [Pseudomonadota bacterium]